MKRAALLLPAMVAQQRNAEIRGTVVDLHSEPIPALQIVLRGAGVERTAHSDEAGRYRFIAVPAGEYEVTITAPFFHTSTIRTLRLRGNAVFVLPPVSMEFEGYDCNTRVPAYLSPLERFDAGKGALGGVITDEQGHALAGAKVNLFVPGSGAAGSTITNREGRFSLGEISSRRDYRIEVTREGYFTEEFTDFKTLPGFEAVYDRLYLEPCEKGRCQASLRPVRILPPCE